jgi:hypothetical protein
MTIESKVTFKEYVKLLYSLAYKKAMMKLILAVAVLLLLWIIFYYLHIFNLPEPVIYQYITMVLILIVQPIVIFITIWRNYYSSNHLRETLKIKISQNEISIEGESFYLEVQWEKLFKIVERRNWFLMYQNNLSAIIIPKKDMSKEEIENLRNILKSLTRVPVDLKNNLYD